MLTAVGFEVESHGLDILSIRCIRRALEEVERHEECSLGNSGVRHNGDHCWLLSHLGISRNHLRLLIEVSSRLRLLDLNHINDWSLLVHFDDSARVSEDLDDGLRS